MNSFLHCVLAIQGHSDRVSMNISDSGLFWVVTKFSLFLVTPPKFFLSVISVKPLIPPLLRGLSQCYRLSSSLLSPSCSLCIQKNPFSCTPLCSLVSSEDRALLFFKVSSNPEQKKQGGYCYNPL